ncbi:hypothetical protein D3C86_1926600 [compost metagenome]
MRFRFDAEQERSLLVQLHLYFIKEQCPQINPLVRTHQFVALRECGFESLLDHPQVGLEEGGAAGTEQRI